MSEVLGVAPSTIWRARTGNKPIAHANKSLPDNRNGVSNEKEA
jgi:hypothetical protein